MESAAEVSAAAILARLKAQQDGMESLLKALESGIADIADPERMQGVERLLSAIESSMADAVEALGKRDDTALNRIAEAIGSIRMPEPVVHVAAPEVTVEAVLPAPVVQVMPAEKQVGAKWKVTIPGQYGAQDRTMTIERTA